MALTPRVNAFEDRIELARNLAALVADALADAIAERGRATLAVSGGSTPARFFKALSAHDIAWDQVSITLVDERCVPETSERSNQRLVVENLLQDKAARARFVPLFNGAPDADTAAEHACAVIDALPRPLDVVILGMGTDGHTASFFPNGSNLAQAITPSTPLAVIPMEAQAAGEPRLTLTLPRIVEAGLLVLHIEGNEKKRVLAEATSEGPAEHMPIRAVLREAGEALEIYWAP